MATGMIKMSYISHLLTNSEDILQLFYFSILYDVYNSLIFKPNKWLILLVSTLAMMADFALLFSFGALYIEIMDIYQTNRATAAAVQSLLVGVGLGFGVFSGALITTLGLPVVTLIASILVPLGFSLSFFVTNIYVLYITIGTVSAVGISMAQVSSVVVAGRVFKGKYQLMSITILNTAVGVASLGYPYLFSWLTGLFGLRGTFLILGGITCNTFLLFIACFKNRGDINDETPTINRKTNNNQKEGNNINQSKANKNRKCINEGNEENKVDTAAIELKDEPSKEKKHHLKNALFFLKRLMTKPYVCLVIAFACGNISLNGYLGVKLDIALWKGLTSSEGLFSFLAFNCSNIVSRLIPGLLKQRRGINSFFYPVFSSLSGCCGQLLIYFSTQLTVYMVGVCLSGIAFGGIVSSSINATVRIVSLDQVPVAIGFLISVNGILIVGVGPLFGAIRDLSGSYGSVLVTISVAQAISSLFFLSAMIFRKYAKKTKDTEDMCKTTTVFTVLDPQITYNTKL